MKEILETALATARAFRGTRNTDWTPVIMRLGEIDPSTPVPDMEMCLVPVGKFMMGSNDGDTDEQPVHEQSMGSPYWIARYPVTNAQWKLAVQAGAVKEPSNTDWYHDSAMAHCPVVHLDWFQSLKFAQWATCNLPTEPLWEYASRGVENWTYPWGNDWEEGERVVWDKNSGGKPNPVTSKPEGASWVGAMHLSGNVWEWQLSAEKDYPYVASDGREGDLSTILISRGLRGGSWGDSHTPKFRSAYRFDIAPDTTIHVWGFRLACFNLGS